MKKRTDFNYFLSKLISLDFEISQIDINWEVANNYNYNVFWLVEFAYLKAEILLFPHIASFILRITIKDFILILECDLDKMDMAKLVKLRGIISNYAMVMLPPKGDPYEQ